MKSDLGKNPEERSLGERGKFKKVKGKQAESGVMWPFVFPTKLWQRSFWHFSMHSIWVATEIQLSACSIHGEGCAVRYVSMRFTFYWARISKNLSVKAASCRCWTTGEMLYSAFLLFLLLHFSFSTDLGVYICSHNRELWPMLMAPSNLASLTRKWHFHTAHWGIVF